MRLHAQSETGTSIVWDNEFETDDAAHAEFLRSVELERLDVILRDPMKVQLRARPLIIRYLWDPVQFPRRQHPDLATTEAAADAR